MGKYDYQKSYARQMETIVLIICQLYGFGELFRGHAMEWNPWGQILVLAGMFISCMLYFAQYKSYPARAYITSALSQITMIIYAVEMDDFYAVVSTYISLCILLGLYGIPKVMFFPGFSYTLIVGYYMFVDKSLTLDSFGSRFGMPMIVLQGYLVLFVICYLVYRYKSTQESMLEMIDALKKSEREKDEFLANVSHEIRTPINTICGTSELMLKKGVPNELKEDILNIQSAGRNLTLVVGDILDYSELQEGEFEIVEENYYISATVNDVINMTMAKKSEKNLELVIDCDANIPSVLIGDEQKIRRVIMNLVNNAIEFTNEGCVCIEFGFRKEEYGINLIVTIRDTGIGMSKESVEKLFRKFSQADMGTSRKKGGVGLGLAIAQAIVNKMGGFITAKSELGKGSEFRFVIPQKVYDEKPVVDIPNKMDINAAVYVNMEQFAYTALRDEYGRNIRHIVEQAGTRGRVFRNLTEFKRWIKRESYNAIFITLVEYREDQVFFDNLSMTTKLYMILDYYDDLEVQNKLIGKIYKPFSVISIVNSVKAQMLEAENAGNVIPEDESMLYAPEANILVIDDNRMNIRVVEGFLREYGLNVSYALSGMEGIRMLAEKEFDLVLLDHMMPEMDGVETLHTIRHKQDPYYKEIPILALTANAIAGTREMLIKEGFDDFLSKPVEGSVLQRALKRHLPKNKQVSYEEYVALHLNNTPKLGGNGVVASTATGTMAAMNAMQGMATKTVVSAKPAEQEPELEFGDLDILKGLTYCGHRKNYIEILMTHKESGDEDMANLQNLYDKEDWKNYTIAIHGAKSSMLSIGAVRLSEMAKALEKAGKHEEFDYIRNEHQNMMEEYRRVIGILKESPLLNPKETVAEEVCNKPAISEEELSGYMTELENATYELDEAKMKDILGSMTGYSYYGADLEKELQPVVKKVEMSDLMSAYDMLVKIKTRLQKA